MYRSRANATPCIDPICNVLSIEVGDCTEVHAAMLHLPIWWLQEAKITACVCTYKEAVVKSEKWNGQIMSARMQPNYELTKYVTNLHGIQPSSSPMCKWLTCMK